MRRGDLYRVAKPSRRDPKKQRVFVVVSRQKVIDARFSTVICAPIYSKHGGLSTQVLVGIDEDLKHDSTVLTQSTFSEAILWSNNLIIRPFSPNIKLVGRFYEPTA